MKWKTNSLYRVKTNFSNEKLSIMDLIYNYQPIIGSSATSLFLTLFAESKSGISDNLFLSHDRLIKITNQMKEELILSFSKLEMFSLLNIYFSEEENRVIYVLEEPQSIKHFEESFINDYLVKKIGLENYKINNAFSKSDASIESFGDQYRLETINQNISRNKSMKLTKEKLELNVSLDLSALFQILQAKDIDYIKWWNRDFESVVREAIVIYDLTFLDIYLIFESILQTQSSISINDFSSFIKRNFENDSVNWMEKVLKSKILNAKKSNLLKTISPEQFINLRLKRVVSISEKRLINNLRNLNHLEDEVINILLDYSIVKNSGNIVYAYLSKIADQINKNKITNTHDVFDFLRQSSANTSTDYYQIGEGDDTIEFVSELYDDEEETTEFTMEVNKTDEEINNIHKLVEEFID